MANKVLWAAESEATLITTTELDNAADGATVLGPSDYVNGTNKFRFADFMLFIDGFDAAPDAGAYIELHLIYKLDGTHYGDGESGDLGAPVLSSNTRVGTFMVADGDALDQYMQITDVQLSPKDFRAAVKIVTGQDLVDSAAHWLKMYPHNEELQ